MGDPNEGVDAEGENEEGEEEEEEDDEDEGDATEEVLPKAAQSAEQVGAMKLNVDTHVQIQTGFLPQIGGMHFCSV